MQCLNSCISMNFDLRGQTVSLFCWNFKLVWYRYIYIYVYNYLFFFYLFVIVHFPYFFHICLKSVWSCERFFSPLIEIWFCVMHLIHSLKNIGDLDRIHGWIHTEWMTLFYRKPWQGVYNHFKEGIFLNFLFAISMRRFERCTMYIVNLRVTDRVMFREFYSLLTWWLKYQLMRNLSLCVKHSIISC